MLGNPKIIFRSLEYFPGGPLVKIPLPLRRGMGLIPWSGKFYMPHGMAKKKKS